MTDGEKMIWAAVYAQALYRAPAFAVLGQHRTQSEYAVGQASAAVASLRELHTLYGHPAAIVMLRQMLEGETLPGPPLANEGDL